jgi:hypothetical protein
MTASRFDVNRWIAVMLATGLFVAGVGAAYASTTKYPNGAKVCESAQSGTTKVS